MRKPKSNFPGFNNLMFESAEKCKPGDKTAKLDLSGVGSDSDDIYEQIPALKTLEITRAAIDEAIRKFSDK